MHWKRKPHPDRSHLDTVDKIAHVGNFVNRHFVRIRYTKHAQKKFRDLEELGVRVTTPIIKRILTSPQHIDTTSDTPKMIASGMLDERHILRIVCRREGDTIVVITFYPAAIGRYRV